MLGDTLNKQPQMARTVRVVSKGPAVWWGKDAGVILVTGQDSGCTGAWVSAPLCARE